MVVIVVLLLVVVGFCDNNVHPSSLALFCLGLSNKGAVTFSIECQIKLIKYKCEGVEESKEVYFNTRKLFSIDGFNYLFNEAIDDRNEKLDNYMSEQPEWVMDKISTIILNIPDSENMCSGNILVCACVQCEEDRQYEGGDDNSETCDESVEDEWLEENVKVKTEMSNPL